MTRLHWSECVFALFLVLGSGCGSHDESSHAGGEDQSWAVTAWGERYEIFAEADPLVVGQLSKSHTHVTVLDGFAALTEGVVSAVLVGEDGEEYIFTKDEALRAGIFSIEIQPENAGTYDLIFRIESAAGQEDISAGRVAVGTESEPGGLVETPLNPAGGDSIAATARNGDAITFLKEQQWRVPFATKWVTAGALQHSVRGPARVRPAAGGEAILTAPLDGIVVPSSHFYVGLQVAHGAPVIELRPRVESGRSFTEIETEWRLASDRLDRLEELLQVEAVSAAEVERARARAAALQTELDAIKGVGPAVAVSAPFGGRIAEVMIVPGQAVAAGDALARLVQTNPLWIEVGLRPELAGALDAREVGLVIKGAAGDPPITFPDEDVRLVSRAPEVDRATGTLHVIFEVPGHPSLRLGTTVHAEILLPQERQGVVVPARAVVDDAGVPVVYIQVDGESFIRREVQVDARQGDRVLVVGLAPGDRILTLGGAAIRRAQQMSSGSVEGHVH